MQQDITMRISDKHQKQTQYEEFGAPDHPILSTVEAVKIPAEG
jgi:hypothetical protein